MNLPFGKPLVIAHRGASSLAPENTLQAAERGWCVAADLWELDVAMSADGVPVVIHDDTLQRTSNAATVFPERSPWEVHKFNVTELARLDFGSWYVKNDPYGQIAAEQVTHEDIRRYLGAQIPTLQEALRFTYERNWRVNIEIKDLTGKPGDNVIVKKVLKLIAELGMDPNVLISSFQHKYLNQVKNLNPRLYTAALVEEVVNDPLALLKATGARAFNPGMDYLPDLDVIGRVRRAGYDVFIWTVNEAEDMTRFIEAGASGLFTDYPQVMVSLLKD